MKNPHQATIDFEDALKEYTGAPFVVCVNSCTMAITLALAYHIMKEDEGFGSLALKCEWMDRTKISIPRPGYISVPQAIIHAGGRPTFRNELWQGQYQLKPFPVWDSARRFTSGMYVKGTFQCVSFHASKNLGLEQGGAILHDTPEADLWLRRARFDGRTPGVHPSKDKFNMIGWHCYMNPSTAAQGLLRLYSLPKHIQDLPNDDYPDLSKIQVFK